MRTQVYAVLPVVVHLVGVAFFRALIVTPRLVNDLAALITIATVQQRRRRGLNAEESVARQQKLKVDQDNAFVQVRLSFSALCPLSVFPPLYHHSL